MNECSWCGDTIREGTSHHITGKKGNEHYYHSKCYQELVDTSREVEGDKPSIYALYSRYCCVYADEHETVQDAIDALQWGTEYGELYAAGVIDYTNRVAYVPIITIEKDFDIRKEHLVKIATDEGIDLEGFRFVWYNSFAD